MTRRKREVPAATLAADAAFDRVTRLAQDVSVALTGMADAEGKPAGPAEGLVMAMVFFLLRIAPADYAAIFFEGPLKDCRQGKFDKTRQQPVLAPWFR